MYVSNTSNSGHTYVGGILAFIRDITMLLLPSFADVTKERTYIRVHLSKRIPLVTRKAEYVLVDYVIEFIWCLVQSISKPIYLCTLALYYRIVTLPIS